LGRLFFNHRFEKQRFANWLRDLASQEAALAMVAKKIFLNRPIDRLPLL
jgi:hypothetical protein